MSHSNGEDSHEMLLSHFKPLPKKESTSRCDAKLVAFVVVGVMTLVYVVGELAAAIYLNSLVLLSDGFHNLSDCISLYIAFWARQAGKRDSTDDMSYGWARSEILGGLTNGCFLLSLCLYVVLEAIPKFIKPIPIESGTLFMIVAGIGLAVNTIGTIIFSLTGQAHSHSHAHGGHGHSHKDKDKKEKKDKKDKKEKHEMDDVEEGHKHGGHGHSHKDKDKDKDKKDKTDKKEKKEKHGHGHEHKEHKEKPKRDLNVHAVFLHYLGDAISSLLVLGAGILIHFFNGPWVSYVDPVSSLVVCTLILFTTIPLVKRCCLILLQSTPNDMDIKHIKKKLAKVEGVISIHDLHIWQLVDGMVIASVHIAVEEGVDFTHLVTEVKKIFHDFGIHSSSIQPEFVPRNFSNTTFCNQNCVRECEEDWCCKKTADKTKSFADEFSIKTEL